MLAPSSCPFPLSVRFRCDIMISPIFSSRARVPMLVIILSIILRSSPPSWPLTTIEIWSRITNLHPTAWAMYRILLTRFAESVDPQWSCKHTIASPFPSLRPIVCSHPVLYSGSSGGFGSRHILLFKASPTIISMVFVRLSSRAMKPTFTPCLSRW